jgi:homoserine O-acetyltransferase
MRDVVASQRALLDSLGIARVALVIGASFGGLQAFQWAVSYPDAVGGVVAMLASLSSVPTDVDGVRATLASDPQWQGGDYYATGDLTGTLTTMRINSLKSYGIDATMARLIPDPAQRAAALAEKAAEWAREFDANALVDVMETMASHDVTPDLARIQAPVLYILSRTDRLFPPSIAPRELALLAGARVKAEYFEIDTENGHVASSADIPLWGPVVAKFMSSLPGQAAPSGRG